MATGSTGPLHGDEFVQLILSLAAQASLLLGLEGGPEQGLPETDPEGARSIISMLEMLQQKTDGRLTAEESSVLEKLLFQLRMAFLERTGGVRP